MPITRVFDEYCQSIYDAYMVVDPSTVGTGSSVDSAFSLGFMGSDKPLFISQHSTSPLWAAFCAGKDRRKKST